MSERQAVLKAALISVEQALRIAEARVEELRKEHGELRKELGAIPDQEPPKTSSP